MLMLSISSLLHVLFAAIWVGGMFFAWVILRPVAAQVLESPERLMLWRRVLAKFFVWVWKSVVLVLLTGYGLAFALWQDMGNWPTHVHVMHGLGLIMALLFLLVFFVPFRRLRQAVDMQDWSAGAAALADIRKLVGVNLALGIVVVISASGGRFYPFG